MRRRIGRESDPAKSREHVLLAVLAERRLLAGKTAELASLLEEVLHPPLERIGALEVNEFLSLKERRALAAALNMLLASASFASWRQGVSLEPTLVFAAGRTLRHEAFTLETTLGALLPARADDPK